MVYPAEVQQVFNDFTLSMLEEINRAAGALNISREATIRSLLRQSLDQHYVATAHQAR